MSVDVYAELAILTATHKKSCIQPDDATKRVPTLRSVSFMLDRLYFDSPDDSQTAISRRAILLELNERFGESRERIEGAIDAVVKDVGASNCLPYDLSAVEYVQYLPPTRQLPEPLVMDIIWNRPLIWQLTEMVCRAQYLMILAYWARSKKTVSPDTFKNRAKFNFTNPLNHAIFSVIYITKEHRYPLFYDSV